MSDRPAAANLCIRADADRNMGIGHVMRCLALAQAWQDDGGEVTLITTTREESLLARLKAEHVRVVHLECVAAGKEDAALCARAARELGGGWLVLDGYHFDRDFHAAVKAGGARLLMLDDTAEADLSEANAILNQNAYATTEMYAQAGGRAALLLGVEYTMLRREFRHGRHTRTDTPVQATKVLVTLGGSDPSNETLRILRALAPFEEWRLEIRLVVGPANPHVALLCEELAALRGRHEVEILVSPPSMPELMNWADLAISASGSSCWELCCMGVPMLLAVTAANQTGVIAHLCDLGIAERLGDDSSAWLARFTALAADGEKRSCMSRKAQLLTDGQGACRVARFLRGASVRPSST